MSLVIPPEYCNARLTIQNTAGGISARSSISIGFLEDAPLTQSDVGRIANLLRDGVSPVYDNAWTMGPTHILEAFEGFEKSWDDSGTEAGTHTGDNYTSPANAWVVTKSTGFAGRRNRGRFYLPSPAEGAVTEAGTMDGTYLNAVQTAMTNLFNALVGDSSITSLALFHDDETPGSTVPVVIDSLLVRSVVGTMRPRQRR